MAREAFVFVQLPGDTTPTVAGRFSLEESIAPPFGTFVYGKSFLSNRNPVALDPVALPLREAEFRTTLNGGFFGAIRDALPDDWGAHVMQQLYGDAYEDTFSRLMLPSGDRFGALSFGSNSVAPEPDPPLAHLNALTDQVLLSLDKIDRKLAISAAERRAAIAFGGGTHAGGARPKLTLEDQGVVWLAKLGRFDEKWDVVRVEAAMLDLAEMCGINVPRRRVQEVAGKELLLVQRFDRNITGAGILKNRVASAATVFAADEAYARANFTGSYMRLSRELARWGVNISNDRRQLYRRIAFNCLTGISDDHERNHALVADGFQFQLAPAFDLSPALPTTRRRMQAMAIGARGAESTRENLLSAIDAFELGLSEAESIINAVKDTVSTGWKRAFADRKVVARDAAALARCFDHSYFESGQRADSSVDSVPS